MPNWKKIIVSGSDAPLNSVEFNTTPSPTPTTQGSVYWNEDDLALSAILNGYIMTIGEDQFYPVKNQTGSNISKGTAVQFAGTLGMSGRLLIQPFLADGSVPSSRFMGVTVEDINNGEDGKVLWFGRIREINTNAFEEGDILYASTTTPGGFQTTIPQAPNNIIQVAAVITKSATVGTIFVRPTLGSNINKDEGVKITTPTTNDILQLQSNGLWENKTLSQAGIQPLLTNPITGSGTAGQVSFWNGTTTQTGDNGLFWDNTNKRLGIGTTSPAFKLNILEINTPINIVGTSETDFSGQDKLLIGHGYSPTSFGISNNITSKIEFTGEATPPGFFGDDIVFSTTDTLMTPGSGDSSSERMRIKAEGNVGVGTTSPSEKLDVQGNIKLTNALLSNQQNTDVDTGTETIATISSTDYDAAFFDFVIKNGTNLRAGTVYAVHDGTDVEFTETSTQDLGSTTDVELSVDLSGGNIRLLATTLSNNWTVKSLVRGL
jgi:hypothetical protein